MSIIQIRKVTKRLDFAAYAPEYEESGDHLLVWVNPPRAKIAEFEQIRAANAELLEDMQRLADDPESVPEAERQAMAAAFTSSPEGFYQWFAEVWSQGPPETRVTAEQVKEFAAECQEVDPQLWVFATAGTWGLINDHLNGTKKG